MLLSGAFLAVQVRETDYGEGNAGAAGFWFAIGVLLLWLVHRRRSRVARGVVIVMALVGAVLYGLVAVGVAGVHGHGAPALPHAVLLALAHLGQAMPLLTGPVRRHVQTAA